jgi:hypothetical protein
VALQNYKDSMKRIHCRYFQKSLKEDRFCPYGKDCFYRHANDDGTLYVFDRGVEYYMPVCLSQLFIDARYINRPYSQIHKRRLNRSFYIDWDLPNPETLLADIRANENPAESLNALNSTIEAFRATLPALLEWDEEDAQDTDGDRTQEQMLMEGGGMTRNMQQLVPICLYSTAFCI